MGSAASKRVEPVPTGLNGDCPRAEDKFLEVDEHARKVPISLMTSDRDLVTYLCKELKDDVSKVRAIYIWIISNKSKLDELHTSRRKQGDILTDKFHSLARIAGIRCSVVKGLHKIPTDQDNPAPTVCGDHSWNAVVLAGKWHVVDCLCGASDDSLESFYFLPDPEQFINNHFPLDTDMSWQFLSKPISLENFNQAPLISETAMARGIRILSPKTRIVNVCNSFDCTINDSQAVLTDFAVVLSSEDGLVHNEFVFISRVEVNSYLIHIRPPFAGNFRLTLQGKISAAVTETITEYVVTCLSAKRRVHKFPSDYTTWGIEPKFPEFVGELCTLPRTFQEVKDGKLDFSFATKSLLEVYASLKWLGDDRTSEGYIGAKTSPSRITLKSDLPKKGFYRVCVYRREADLLYPVAYLLVYSKKGASSRTTPSINSNTNAEILV